MYLPRRHTKALESLVSQPQKKKATSNQGIIKILKNDGGTLYGLWERNTFSSEPVSLIFLSEPGIIPLTELDANPNIHHYTIYQLKNQELQREFQKAIIKRHISGEGGLASLLEPLVYSGKYNGDQYLKLLAYLAVIKPSDTEVSHRSISDTTYSEDITKIIDKNLQAIEKLLSNNDCPIKVKPHEATAGIEEIMFEPVVL
jgi:hypothetical protein